MIRDGGSSARTAAPIAVAWNVRMRKSKDRSMFISRIGSGGHGKSFAGVVHDGLLPTRHGTAGRRGSLGFFGPRIFSLRSCGQTGILVDWQLATNFKIAASRTPGENSHCLY